jgi:hypothetical protein
MKALFRLIPTPRAGKRFVNIYRLIRASVEPAELARFTGAGPTSQYRAVMLLLAILTGFPSQGTEILQHLLTGAKPTEPWWPFLDALLTREQTDPYLNERWARLAESLEPLRGFVPQNMLSGAFIRWADDVARYSFESGRVLLSSRYETANPV